MFSVIAEVATSHLNLVREGRLSPQETNVVVGAIRLQNDRSFFTLDDIGTNEEELNSLLKKAGYRPRTF